MILLCVRLFSNSVMIVKSVSAVVDGAYRFVVAVNESPSSRRALEMAAKLARPCDSICVFHILDTYRGVLRSSTTNLGTYFEDIGSEPGSPKFANAADAQSDAIDGSFFAMSNAHSKRQREWKQAVLDANRRADSISARYKKKGFNVVVVDPVEEEFEGDVVAQQSLRPEDNDIFPYEALLASKIVSASCSLSPTFLILGIGNAVSASAQDDDKRKMSIVEAVVDSTAVTCSVLLVR